MLGLLKHTFSKYDSSIAKIVYPVFVRPHLEFATASWNALLEKDVLVLEKVQRKATKTSDLRGLSYEQRLRLYGITDLKTRRKRGDLIQVYKLVYGLEEIRWTNSSWIDFNGRTNDGPKLKSERYTVPARFHVLLNRVATDWNSLKLTTRRAPNVASFKSALDREMSGHVYRTSIYKR